VEGKLLLTEQEWHERSKTKETGEGSWGGSTGDHGCRGRGGGNRGRGRGRGDGSDASGRRRDSNCHRCGKLGHWAQDYRTKQPKKDESTFTAQEEESLLLAEVNSI
jgi:hypothetical protein